MRGPGHKWVNPIRRTWRCPACGYERHVSGVETTVRCRCAEGPFMKLVAEPRFHRPPPKPVNIYFEAEELLGLRDSAAAPPTDPPSAAVEEFGVGTSAAVEAPVTPSPAPLSEPEKHPAVVSGEETVAATGLPSAVPFAQDWRESARPSGPTSGAGRSTEGGGQRPRDQRRRGGRPRGPQAPRE